MNTRYCGYVVGSNPSSEGRTVWTVRVKNPGTPYDGHKLVVASIRGGMELARGLNVNFAIGTVDDRTGIKVPRAVDVCLESADGHNLNPVNQVNQSGEKS